MRELEELTLVIGKSKWDVKQRIFKVINMKKQYTSFFVNPYVRFIVAMKPDGFLVVEVKVMTISKYRKWTPSFEDIRSLYKLIEYVSNLNKYRSW